MASNHTVSSDELTPGDIVLVSGKTAFSRLAKVVEGEELTRLNQKSKFPITVPYTTITVSGAEVLPRDPNNPTKAEIFVQERRYVSNTKPELGPQYRIDNKSTSLPVVRKLNDAGEAEQITLTGELAADVPVILVLRVFQPKNYTNKGLSLQQVIIQETTVRYYGASDIDEQLAARGIIFAAPTQPQTNDVVETAPAQTFGSPIEDAPDFAPVSQQNAFQAPAQQPQQNPFQSAPVPASEPVTINRDGDSAFGDPAPQAPAQQNPWGQPAQQATPGITYDPNNVSGGW